MAKTVLVVDDVPFVRQTLAQILVEAGYQVVGEAADGTEACEQYRKLNPDIVTMDVVMPQMSGIEATRKIISNHKEAKIVIVTAMGQENLVMEAINVGAKDYVLKPFRTEDILKTIERILSADDKLLTRPTPRKNKA